MSFSYFVQNKLRFLSIILVLASLLYSTYPLSTARAQVDTLTLGAFPTVITADGLSTTTLTAYAYTDTGGPVADGTLVTFSTTLGTFAGSSTTSATTTNGLATAVLTSAPSRTTILADVTAVSESHVGAASVSFQANLCASDLSHWTEYNNNPVFGQGASGPTAAYYPTVIYDLNRFTGHGSAAYYKLWYSTGSSLGVTTSEDGLSWGLPVTLTGLTNPHHARVLYDPSGFGGTGYYYKIWYWDTSKLYYDSGQSIRFAKSSDGVSWTGDQAVFGGVAGYPWQRGSYGPVDVLYNPSGTDTPGNPLSFVYVMYYNGTDGGYEQVGLAYSPDGIAWTRYSLDSPVLTAGGWPGLWGASSPWDSSYVTYGTVIKVQDGSYRFWYSGGTTAADQGIGYAVSSDGIHWTKSHDNPIFSYTDGIPWRNLRTYTPFVLYSPTRFDGHGPLSDYKMWFSGRQSGTNFTAIGAAILNPVTLTKTSGDGQSGLAHAPLSQPFVATLTDACGSPVSGVAVNFAISSNPPGASGQALSVASAISDSSGHASTSLTLGNLAGAYTISASASAVNGSPLSFSAAATTTPPDLSTSLKTVDKPIAHAGDLLTYTITLTNTGTDDTQATFYDPFPPGTSFVSSNGPAYPVTLAMRDPSQLDDVNAPAQTLQEPTGIYWNGIVPGLSTITLHFKVQIGLDMVKGVVDNEAWINYVRGGWVQVVSLSAQTVINPATQIYLPFLTRILP